MPPKRKATSSSRSGKRTKKRIYVGTYQRGTIFDLGKPSLTKAQKVKRGRENQRTDRMERAAYQDLSTDFLNFATEEEIRKAEDMGYISGSTRDMSLSQIQDANEYFAKYFEKRDEEMRVGIPVELDDPMGRPRPDNGHINASILPPPEKERPKVTKTHANSLNEVTDIVKKHPPFSEAIFGLLQTGITYFTGSPWAGEVAANVLRGLWNNRGLLKRGFDKIVGFFRNLRRGGDPNKIVPQIEAAPTALVAVHDAMALQRAQKAKELSTPQGIKSTLKGLIQRNIGVAKALFENPSTEKVMEILTEAAKRNGVPVTEGMVDTCKALIKQDEDLNKQLTLYTEVKNRVESTTETVRKAIATGDLVAISSAIGNLRTSLDSYSNLTLVPSNVITDGLSQLLLESGNRMKTLVEERHMAGDKLRTAKAELATATAEQERLTREYNALVKVQQTEHQRIDEEKEALVRRNEETAGSLEEMRQKFKAAEEKRLSAEANLQALTLQFQEIDTNAKNQVAVLENLRQEKNALSLAGEQQMITLNNLQTANGALTTRNNELIAILDENKKKIEELMTQSTENLLKLKEREGTIVVNEKRIDDLNGQIIKLQDQIANLQQLQKTSEELISKKAEEVVTAQMNGDATAKDLQAKLQAEIEKTRALQTSYKESEAKYKKEIAEKTSSIQTLTAENSKFRAQIDANNLTIESGRKALEDSEEINQRLSMKQDFWKAEIEKLQTSNAKLEGELLEYAARENSMKISLVNAEQQNAELVTQDEQMRLDLSKEQRERAAERKQLEAQLTQKEKELEALKIDLIKQNQTIQESQDAIGHNVFSKGWNWLFHHSKRGKAIEAKKAAQKKVADDKMEIEGNENEQQRLAAQHQENLQLAQEQLHHAQENIWRVIRGEVLEQGQAMRKIRGGILTPTAPDWNLQPNDRIAKFWSDFYAKSFHPF